jgi:GntR family transcriptional repressor for pyruvate dehydrogenase complex
MADPGEAPDPLEADAWLPVDLVRGQSAEAGETLPEQIADRIAGLIGSGTLRPGARLPSERELARIFGVSRLAVREAAHRLEARGLVVVRRGAGSFVATPAATMPDPAEAQVPPTVDLEDLSDVRMLLEPAAADWAARRGDRASLAVLLRIAEQFEAAADSAEPRFDLLAQLIEQLLDLHRLRLEWSLRRPGRLEEIAVEHRRLVDAITAADPLAARDAMLAHLAASAASFRTLAAGDAPLD